MEKNDYLLSGLNLPLFTSQLINYSYDFADFTDFEENVRNTGRL